MNNSIFLSEDQTEALAVMEQMLPDSMVFVTGKAGSGKSTLVNMFIEGGFSNTITLAPTGIAAQNVGGRTIHSFLGIRPGDNNVDLIMLEMRMKGAEYIIIDEISMVSAELFYLLVRSVREVGPYIKWIFIGDFHQLPPVKGKFCNTTPLWKEEVQEIELTTIHRQSDPIYLDALNDIRVGNYKTEAVKALVQARAGVEPSKDALLITPRRATADSFNQKKLERASGNAFTREAEIIFGEWKDNRIPQTIKIKEGCPILMLTNDPSGYWQNGTRGTVRSVYNHDNMIEIDLEGGLRARVTPIRHELLNGNGEPYLAFYQYPFQLGYAITIHKSQGMTISELIVDMKGHFGGPSMTYVALSRCASMDGLYLVGI